MEPWQKYDTLFQNIAMQSNTSRITYIFLIKIAMVIMFYRLIN